MYNDQKRKIFETKKQNKKNLKCKKLKMKKKIET